MWFIRVVVVASLFIMLICSSESKPQAGLADNLSDAQLLAGFGVGPTDKESQAEDPLFNAFQNAGLLTPAPTTNNGPCTCVSFSLCCDPRPENNAGGNIDGAFVLEGVVNPRNHQNEIIDVNDRQNINCQNTLEVCCNTVCTSTPQPPPIVHTLTNDECGISNPNGVGVTIQGFQDGQAQLGEFPWMVAVLDQQTNYVGGGSLVHPKIILTAAHKVQGKTDLVARIGDWDLSAELEKIANQNIIVERVLIHPSFNRATLVNDVALLILQRNATLGQTVRTICLPQTHHNFDNFEGSNCIVTGWGKDVFGATGRHQQIMKEVIVPAVSHSECQRMLQNTRLGSDFFLHKTFNCAGANGEDACTGDGGSPLACKDPNNSNRYIQMGVVAWGIGCGVVGNPGVYGSVPQTVEWIRQIIQEEGSTGFDVRAGP